MVEGFSKEEEKHECEGPNGDIFHDYYLDLDKITDPEELKYIELGRGAVKHLLQELPL